MFGIWIFALPSSTFGTGLALYIQGQNCSTSYRSQSAKLIQTIWRFYSVKTKSMIEYKNYYILIYKKKTFNDNDRNCILFITVLKYLWVKHNFQRISSAERPGPENEYSLIESLNRIERIEEKVHLNKNKLKSNKIILDRTQDALKNTILRITTIQQTLNRQ